MKFRERHDIIAHDRQQRLAQLLILANGGIAIFAGLFMLAFQWNPEPTTVELLLLAALVAFSWACLCIAAGAIGWLADVLSGVPQAPRSGDPALDERFLARNRMVFYYAGVIVNIAVFAVVVGITGGVAHSPFAALLVALLLTSQQLSRFRTQAIGMFGVGLAVIIAMLHFEPPASDRAPAPDEFVVAAIFLALIVGSFLNLVEKPSNHYVAKLKEPSRLLTYQDGGGNWRFALYRGSRRQDPVLLACDGVENKFPDGLKEQLEKYASKVDLTVDRHTALPPREFTTCFAVRLEAGASR